MTIPIVIVAYKRTDTIKRLLASLSEAHYAVVVPLIISIDKSYTDEVEIFADAYEWEYGPKIVIRHNVNLGLRKHILSIGEFTKEYDAVIVLEDDLIVSPCFYDYALATVSKYKDCENIAGISLYNFPFNNYLSLPFHPQKDEYDAYMMQIAQSWGQIWLKNQWAEFIKWYKINFQEFEYEAHLPKNICQWGKNSWLKFHNKYCIEEDKYFVYPYVSLTSNSGSAGTHSTIDTNITQTILQMGKKNDYFLPNFESATKYDGFYESTQLENALNLDDNVCVDLYGLKKNALMDRYWITTEKADFKVIKTFGFQYYPIEENVIRQASGSSIFLYDTYVKEKNVYPDNTFDIISHHFKIRGIYTLLKRKGFIKVLIKILKVLFTKKL